MCGKDKSNDLGMSAFSYRNGKSSQTATGLARLLLDF
jgi:hypothetical protein